MGIDIGYGFVKGINERGEKVRFRSLICPEYDRKMGSLFGAEEEENELHVVVRRSDNQSKSLYVGDLALESGNTSYAFDRNKVNHPTTKILLATATSMLGQNVSEPIHLITGLPYDHYFEQKNEFEKALRSLEVIVEHKAGKFKGRSKKIKFGKVTTFVQGGASIYSSMMDVNGMPVRKDLLGSGDLIAVINIGFRTVDIVVFEAGKKFRLIPSLSFTIDTNVGMIAIRNTAQDAFFRETGLRLTLPQIESIIEKGGKQYHRGKQVDISGDILAAKETVATNIKGHTTSRWGNNIDLIRTVFLNGGGALDVQEQFTGFHPGLEIPDDSQFADAIGYLIVGRLEEMMEMNRTRMRA